MYGPTPHLYTLAETAFDLFPNPVVINSPVGKSTSKQHAFESLSAYNPVPIPRSIIFPTILESLLLLVILIRSSEFFFLRKENKNILIFRMQLAMQILEIMSRTQVGMKNT